jgi:hypothetical protein
VATDFTLSPRVITTLGYSLLKFPIKESLADLRSANAHL